MSDSTDQSDCAAQPSTDLATTGVASRGRRAVLTLFDQGLASLSNFSVGVVVARVAGASGLGGFAFAYAGWQVISAMHRALITDPMAIAGDVRDGRLIKGIQRGFAAEILLGVTGAIAMASIGFLLILTGQHTFGTAVAAMAPWLPILTVQDYWRWMGFLTGKPGRALANDIVFNCAQGAALALMFAIHVHSMVAVIACWGIGGVAGALFGLRQHRVLLSLRGGLTLLRSRWSFSKWIAANQLVGTGQGQILVVIAGAILGPIGLGGFKAAQALVVGPAGILIQAGGSYGLPEACKAYSERQWSGLMRVARLVTWVGVTGIVLMVVAIAIWGRELLSLLYGPAFAHFQLTSLLVGIGYLLIAYNHGPTLVLKATQNTHLLFHTQLVTLFVSLSSFTSLSLLYGVTGTAIATIISAAVILACLLVFQRRVHRSLHPPGTTASPAASARAETTAFHAPTAASGGPTSSPAR